MDMRVGDDDDDDEFLNWKKSVDAFQQKKLQEAKGPAESRPNGGTESSAEENMTNYAKMKSQIAKNKTENILNVGLGISIGTLGVLGAALIVSSILPQKR